MGRQPSTLQTNSAYLFKQVIIDMSTYRVSFEIKVDIHVFSKSAGVVVTVGFGIAEGL